MKENIVGKSVSILSNQLKRQFDLIFSKEEITGVQGRVLHYIFDHVESRDVFQKDIEEEFNLRRSTATGILQLIEKRDYIRRESVPYDARLKKIIMTKKGIEMSGRVEANLQMIEKKVCGNIPEKDIETFFRVIEQMQRNLE